MALLPRCDTTRPISEISALFHDAREEELAPFNWIPPKWNTLTGPGFLLPDTSPELNDFKSPGANDGSEAETGEFVSDRNTFEIEDQPGSDPTEETWVHPGSDFRHIDPDGFSDADVAKLGPILSTDTAVFDKLKRVVGSESLGMVRLARVFDWTLWRATVLLNDINRALDNGNLEAFGGGQQPATRQAKYEAARDHYIAFLTDIDDREPETKPDTIDPLDPRSRSAYGRAIK